MVNYNPNFDEAEELGWERVMDVFEVEGTQGARCCCQC